MKKLLIFHPTIAPYRIDFFNDLYKMFDTRICLRYRNLRSQKFDYDKIASQFEFSPIYQDSDVKGHSRDFYWKNLDEHNPDIVIVEEFSIGALFVLLHRFLKRKKYRVISMCDDSYNMVAENNDFSKFHKIARRLLVPHLDDLILVEPKVTEWYQRKYGKGVCFPIIKTDDKARKEYERVLPLSKELADKNNLQGKNVFLFVGRLVALKNVETAIKAFSRLNQTENTFIIIGDGPEREKLEYISQELNANVKFMGRLEGDELLAWYNVADVFVLPSYQEAFGAVTNEALLAGCKVIISKKAGSSCLVEEGINGFTFEPMNVNELVDKMKSVLDNVSPLKEIVLKSNNMKSSYQEHFNKVTEFLNNFE